MRLFPEQIRQGIQHSDRNVRSCALAYFTDAHANDPLTMHAAMAAIDQYGLAEAFEGPLLSQLGQDEASIDWTLNKIASLGTTEEDLRTYLADILVNADIDLVTARLTDIEKSVVTDAQRTAVKERMEFRSLQTKQCWTRLEAFAERERNTEFVNEADLPHAYRLVEAIASNPKSADRVIEILGEEVDESDGNPKTWMEGFAVRLAGELRLNDAIPTLLQKLTVDAEWLNEECVFAFVKFGSDEVIDQLLAGFPDAPWHYRLSTAFILEAIHTDRSVAACKQLIEQVQDLKVDFTTAMLSHYSDEAVEVARDVLNNHSSGEEVLRCRQVLLGVSPLLGAEFPELEAWRTEEQVQQEAIETPQPDFEVVDDYDKLLTVAAPASTQTKAATQPRKSALPARSTMFQNRGIGRNDPCPCGSGKKYKKCCMRR